MTAADAHVVNCFSLHKNSDANLAPLMGAWSLQEVVELMDKTFVLIKRWPACCHGTDYALTLPNVGFIIAPPPLCRARLRIIL